ncbi:hypothetical protein GCK72_010735 [Caenorhabditis remanei]|uniref:Uncharacterized protein n=1 Tax=Caenorhabditis remanei TaxID=31234 RepID=E3LWW0_CAERE|nr:hypothetical protein GCK72_010735 [Caenorhabditis remanei]EFO83677.1 hypothetical protein CRE_03161 [Caenorhabditis remanei]KAF1762473.1 hypothetical protein GCK72_010735 [Caenorhabditis remanei]
MTSAEVDIFEIRRQKVFTTIESIGTQKSEIAAALRGLGVGSVEDDEAVKYSIEQLMAAYDAICSQEKLWMELLKEINELEKKEEKQ